MHDIGRWCQFIDFRSQLTRKVIQKSLFFFCKTQQKPINLRFATIETCAPLIFRTSVFNWYIEYGTGVLYAELKRKFFKHKYETNFNKEK